MIACKLGQVTEQINEYTVDIKISMVVPLNHIYTGMGSHNVCSQECMNLMQSLFSLFLYNLALCDEIQQTLNQ